MPVHEIRGGYKYGETGKTYKKKKDAIKQALAIAYSKARKKGRKPTQEEIETEIKGNPEESMDKVASALRKIAADWGRRMAQPTAPAKARKPEFPNMPAPKGGWSGPEAVNPPNKKKPVAKTPDRPTPNRPLTEREVLDINSRPGNILEIKNGKYVN